ncbi:unnamed protein product [Amaranthus hypochondriacus]
MAQNQRQILLVVALIVVISASNIAQALNINPNACALFVTNLKNDPFFHQPSANTDPNAKIQFIMDQFKDDRCLIDFPRLDQECLSQVAKDFLNLVQTTPGDFEITPEQVLTTIAQDNDLPNVCSLA